MIGLRNDSGYDNKRSLEEGVSFDSYLSAWTQNLEANLDGRHAAVNTIRFKQSSTILRLPCEATDCAA